MLCRPGTHAFPPQFSGRSFLGWSRWQVDPQRWFRRWTRVLECSTVSGATNTGNGAGHYFGIILAIILAVLSQRLSGGGAGESPREKKKLQFAFGCLESGFLEGQLKSDRCLFQRLKRSPDRKATLRRVYHLEKPGRGGVFLVYMRFAMTSDSGSP